MLIVLWAVAGPFFKFGDTWQLVINITTTINTFLMVFLIQNSQNRNGEALQIKTDELIRIQKKANNALMDLEDFSEQELDAVRPKFVTLAEEKRKRDGLEEQGRRSEPPARDSGFTSGGEEARALQHFPEAPPRAQGPALDWGHEIRT